MILLTFKQPASVDTRRGYVATVEPGTPYVMTDYHVKRCVPRQACRDLAPYERFRPFPGGQLEDKSLLILWLAGFGDTVTFAPSLISLQAQCPQARIDVLTIPPLFEILAAAEFQGRLVDYPATAKTIEQYDYFTPLECMSKNPHYFQLTSIDFYAELLHQPQGLPPARFTADQSAIEKVQLSPGALIRVGIQVRGLSPLRTYPSDLSAEVMRGLVRGGYEVHLMGLEEDCNAPSAPPLLYNDCGRTTSFGETVALLQQMQAMICPDSFLMHLAGSMSIPTVAVFSTISPRLRIGSYRTVVGLMPDIPCAPCSAIDDEQCPIGHPECVAFRTPNVSPKTILATLEKLVIESLCAENAQIHSADPATRAL